MAEPGMRYTTLGASGIRVSRICMGCMGFGDPARWTHPWTLGPGESEAVVRAALDLGINFFDTANVYSGGTSEEYLGRALKGLLPRDRVVIATKVYFNEGHLSREAILREAEGSLRRLGTDYIDLYVIHRFDHDTPALETLAALDSLVRAGKVRALGASAMYADQFEHLQRVARENGWAAFVSMQNHWNLLYREDEKDLVPLCKGMGVALTPYSPLAAGRLARPGWAADTARSLTDATAAQKYDATREGDEAIARRVEQVALRLGVPMTQVALAWLFRRGASAPVVGATKAVHLRDAAGAVELELTQEDADFLEEPYHPHSVVGALPRPS